MLTADLTVLINNSTCLPLFDLMYVGVPTYKPSFLGTACLFGFIDNNYCYTINVLHDCLNSSTK